MKNIFVVLLFTFFYISCASLTGPVGDNNMDYEMDDAPEAEEIADIEGEEEELEEEMAEMEEISPDEKMASYKVRKGDTLMKIAHHLYGDVSRWRDILSWNQDIISKSTDLSIGSQLKFVDTNRFYVKKLKHSYLIQEGNTLGGIAARLYGQFSKWQKLQNYNSRLIRDPNIIYAGFLLYYSISKQELKAAKGVKISSRSKRRLPSKVKRINRSPAGFNKKSAPSK